MLLLSLLLLLITESHATQIESTFLNTFVANGSQGQQTQWQQKRLTFACSNRESRDTSVQIGNLFYDINCLPPQYIYQTLLRLFVPHKIRRYTAETCEQTGGQNITDPNLPNEDVAIDATARRLLSFFGSIGDAFTSWFSVSDCDQGFFNKLLSDISGKPVQCGRGISPVINPNVISTQLHTLELLRTWLQQQVVVDAAIAGAASDISKTINVTEQGLLADQQMLLQINQSVNTVAATTDAQYTAVHTEFTGLISDLSRELGGLQQLSQRQQLFENVTNANLLATTTAFQQLTAQVQQDFASAIDRGYRILRQIRLVLLRKAKRFSKEAIRRSLTRQTFNLAQRAVADGLVPFWDPSQSGQAPAATSLLVNPATRTTFLDVQYVNWINGTTDPTVHQLKVVYNCDVVYVLNTFYPDPDWPDLLTQLGPPGCTSLPGNPVDNCNCWLEITHRTCKANTAAPQGDATRDFSWQQVQPGVDLNAFVLDANPTYCFGTGGARTSPGPWTGQLISDVNVWNALLSQLCNVQLTPATLSSGPRQMQLVSTRVGPINVAQPVNPQDTCKPNYDAVFETGADSSNIIFAIYSKWITAQNLLVQDQPQFERLIYGIPPNFLTYETLPFRMLSNNKTYTCYQASFVAVSEETRPVFELIPQGSNPVVQITGYLSPPICDTSGCVFGPAAPASSQVTSDVTVSVPFDFLLPDGSDTIVGEWRTHGSPPMTLLADLPRGAAPVHNVDVDKRGTATYIWQPIPAGYSLAAQTSFQEDFVAPTGPWPATTLLDGWNARSSLTFNARDASISVDLTEVDFVNGQASVDIGHELEWAGKMFQHFQLHPLTDMRTKGLLVLTPREWNYVVTADVVDGEIIQRVFAGCPEFEFLSYTNGYQELILTNSLPLQITTHVSFGVDTTVCLPIAEMHFTLQPKQIQQQIIYGCPSASVSVFTSAPDGSMTPCEVARNISYAPGDQGNIDYFTDDTTMAPVLSTAIADNYVQSQRGFLAALKSAVPYIVPQFTPTLTTLERTTAIADIFNALNATLQQQIQDARTATQTLSNSASIAPLVALTRALNTKLTSLNADLTVQVAKVDADAKDIAKQVSVENVLSNKTVQGMTEEILADQQNLQNLQHQASASYGLCSWCTDWLDPPPPSLTLSDPSTVLSNVASPFRSTLGSFICPLLCGVLKILLVGLLVVCLVCLCPPLCKGLCNLTRTRE